MSRTLPLADVAANPAPRRRRARHQHEQIPEVALRLARVLRSGVPIESAIAQVDADVARGHINTHKAARHLASGRPLSEVVTLWSRNTGCDAERLLVGAIEVGVETGADLADALDAVGEAIRDDVDHDRRRRILLTQTQMSAVVLVSLPLLFALVSSITRGVPYSGSSGYLLLAAGLTLDLLGMLWIRRLLARLT